MFRRFALLLLAAALPVAATAANQKKPASAPAVPRKTANPPGIPSLLGFTAVTTKLPVTPASASIDWVSGVSVSWAELEPVRGQRSFTPLDDRIRQLGEAGAAAIPAFESRSPWGSAPPPEDWPTLRREKANTMPQDEAAWASFVRDVVERYDGDGKDDMPGLLRPVHSWQLMPDLGVSWAPKSGETVTYMAVTSAAIREADPGAVTILGGITEGDIDLVAVDSGLIPLLFQGKQRISRGTVRSVDALSSRVQFVRDVLVARDSYNVLDIHHLLSSNGIADRMRYVREDLLKAAGAAGKNVVSLYNAVPSIPGGMPDTTSVASELIRSAFGCFLGGCRRFAWPAEAAALPAAAVLAPYPMVDADGKEQPSRKAFAELGRRLRTSSEIRLWRSPGDAPNARVARVECDPGESFVAVWNEANNSLTATFPASGTVTVVDGVTLAKSRLTAKNGEVRIPIGPVPVYVTGIAEPGTTAPPAEPPKGSRKKGSSKK